MRPALLALLLLGCSSPSSSDPDALLRRVMGSNDRLKLEIQLLTPDPVDEAAIRGRVNLIVHNLEQLPHSAGKRDEAIALLRALAAQPWTGAAPARWAALEQSCDVCHASMPKRTPKPVVNLRAWTSKTSFDACGACHRAVFDEWRQTLHAGAWLDPVYRMSAGNPPKTECRGCHSMEPILAGEIDTDYSWRPIYRDYNQDDGVGCVACHLRADGTVAARRDGEAPCRPRRDDRITTPEYCGACHNPSHDAFNEWKKTAYAKQGVTCSSCHSFPVARTLADGSKKVGFSHSFPGGNAPEFVSRSIHAEYALDKRVVVVTVDNRCGHKFPGEVPTRAFGIRVETWDAADQPLETDELWLKRPFKSQVGVPDSRLEPDERRVIRRPLAAGAVFVRVTLIFKPSPLMMERGWTKLDRWESKVPQ